VIGRLVQKRVDTEVARGGEAGAVFGAAPRPDVDVEVVEVMIGD
jgi:hypothetical protein